MFYLFILQSPSFLSSLKWTIYNIRHEQLKYDPDEKYKNQTLRDKAKDTVKGIYSREIDGKVRQAESNQGKNENGQGKQKDIVHLSW